jgi:hypothetical protein
MIRIKDIRIKTENILLFLFLLPVIIDQLNGFMQAEMGIAFSISQILKTVYLLLSFVFLAKLNRKYLLLVMIFISILSAPLFINVFSERIIFLSVFGDLAFIFKVITFPAFFLTFITLSSRFDDVITIRFCRKTVNWIFYILLFALLASVVGFGKGMYGDVENMKVGFKGYFIAGNELSSLFVVVYTFFLYFSVLNDNLKKIYFKVFMGMLCAVLMSTKTTLISFVLVTLSVPALNYYFSGRSFVKLIAGNTRKIFAGIIFLSSSLMGIYYLFRQNIDLYIDKMTYALSMADSFLTFLLSARNLRYADSLEIYDNYSLIEKIFGTGWTYPQHFIEKRIWGWGSSETDWLDLLVAHGFVGVVSVYLFWLAVLFFTGRNFFGKISGFSVPSFIAMFLLLVNTTFSGHILYSAMTGIYLAFFISFQFKNIEDRQ